MKERFHRKLRELGWVEGRDLSIDYKLGTEPDELARFAAEFVTERVDLIVASGGNAQHAAADATATIPIVAVRGGDPVALGHADSHARPGRNVTGVSWETTKEGPKKLELLKEAVPNIRRVAFLYRSDNTSVTSARAALEASPGLGVGGKIFGTKSVAETHAILDEVAGGSFDALHVTSIMTFVENAAILPDFAAGLHIPQIFGDIDIVRAGGLMHYGTNFDAQDEQSAVFVDKILRGANPAELPIYLMPTRDFVVNRGAAKRIGIEFPTSIIRQATDMIG